MWLYTYKKRGLCSLLVPRYVALALPFRSNKQREAHANMYIRAPYVYN